MGKFSIVDALFDLGIMVGGAGIGAMLGWLLGVNLVIAAVLGGSFAIVIWREFDVDRW